MLTVERLRQVLKYDPETGAFIWLVATGHSKVGNPAGYVNAAGYRIIMVDGHNHRGARLAWAIMTGNWPAALVDHKDRNRSNDTWGNLREATVKQNAENRSREAGRLGVSWNRRRKQWQAKICHNRKQIHLGWFSAEPAAILARKSAERRLFTHAGV